MPKPTDTPEVTETTEQALTDDHRAHIKSVRALTHQLVEATAGAASHRLILEALMTTYVAVAESHPCCAAEAGRVALRCASRLVSFAAASGHSGTVH